MLTLTGKQLRQGQTAFIAFAAEKVKGNQKLAYNLGKTSKEYRAELESIEKQVGEVFKSFGAVEKDNQYLLDQSALPVDKKADFDAAIKQIDEIQVELWGTKITLAEIEKAQIDLSPIQFDLLSWLIADPESAPAETPAASSAAGASQ